MKKTIYGLLLSALLMFSSPSNAQSPAALPVEDALKKAFPGTTVHQLRDSFSNDRQTIVRYLPDKGSHRILVLNQDRLMIKCIENQGELENTVLAFYSLLSAYPNLFLRGITHDDSLANLAYRLYRQLVAPVEEAFTEELIIIPEGILDQLPFEALLCEPAEDSLDYHQMAWLLHRYVISYGYSSDWSLKSGGKEDLPAKQLLCVAPELPVRDDLFGSLEYHLREAKEINRLMGGDLLLGRQATVEIFKNLAADYRILHLATHALTGSRQGEPSFLSLAVSPDSYRPGELRVSDICDMKLNAEMVVLSACRTGTGGLKSGESDLSLSEAFICAGAKSLLSTLWQINDRTTAALMRLFYLQIASNERKHIALRNAKLEWMENAKGDSGHPFYWAPFRIFGDTSPVMRPAGGKDWKYYWLSVVAAGSLLFLFIWFRKRNWSS